jgi:hypothetical protein
MSRSETAPRPAAISSTTPGETRFVNAVRLSGRQWLIVFILLLVTVVATPLIWQKLERFETGPDYRIPYPLSKDYWLYQRRLQQLCLTNIVVLGDSVVWGEYVQPTGTLTHFVNVQTGNSSRFVNGGVNGLFPLAFEGLIRNYGKSLHNRKIILHCNLLWMSSPKADLHTDKEERFNHADLVPQFSPRIPCYKADLNHRIAAVIQRNFAFSGWANHVQIDYFGQNNVLAWTLEEGEGSTTGFPNAFKNPLAQITFRVPVEPAEDPERGPKSERHKPWSTTGQGSTRFEWVTLDQSLQWAAFQRLVRLLRSRGNDLLVIVGPFNEHIMSQDNQLEFRGLRDGVLHWLDQEHINYLSPQPLESALYADASHPLTQGYEVLAEQLCKDPKFQEWANIK